MHNPHRPYGLLVVAFALLGIGAAVLLYPRWTAWQYSCQVTEQHTRFSSQVTPAAKESSQGSRGWMVPTVPGTAAPQPDPVRNQPG